MKNLSSIGCLVAEKSLCGGWYNSRIESLQVLSTLDFGLWTLDLDLDLDLDCDNNQLWDELVKMD